MHAQEGDRTPASASPPAPALSRRSSEAGPSACYRLDIEFAGAAYFGWQFQPNRPTVQGAVETALARLFGCRVPVIGAGRTDTGVSALNYPASFTAPRPLEPGVIRAALNQALPEDIHVRRVRQVPAVFHARYSARSRVYRYTIRQGRSPLLRRQTWEVLHPLDAELMARAARLFVGRHDLAPFCRLTAPGDGRVTVKRVGVRARRCALSGAALLQVEVEADHFLYKLVRRMVGALVDIGRGKFTLADLDQAIKDRPRVQFSTAPASGLVLVQVRY